MPERPSRPTTTRLRHWLPRVLALGFAISLLVPAPAFVTRMGNDEFLVWAARLAWVLGVPTLFGAVLWAIAVLGKPKRP